MRLRRLFIPLLVPATALALVGAWSTPAGAHDPDMPHGGAHATPGGADAASPAVRHLKNLPRSSPVFNSDLAFKGRYAIAGNYNGFRVIDVSNPADPTVVRDVWCPGPQNDVSIWGDTIVLSVDSVRTNDTCNSAALAPPFIGNVGWEGLRFFSLSQVLATAPDPDGFTRLAAAKTVFTDCGSHTHTGVPDGNRVLIYVSSYPLRSGPTCGPHDDPGDTHDPLHKKISIVELANPANPASAHLLKTVPVNVPTWNLLPAPFNPMQGCHDIQVFLKVKKAAAACSSVGQQWDISDPANPKTLAYDWQVDEPQVEFYHSAAFTWDAKIVIFGDEALFQNCDDGSGAGQIWFHDGATGTRKGSFQIPRSQGGTYCSAHMFNVLKTGHGYRLVSAWYTGGLTVVNFTNPANAKEIAYFDPAPVIADDEGYWSAYGYNGIVYANGLHRGFDSVFVPQAVGGSFVPQLNPQTQ